MSSGAIAIVVVAVLAVLLMIVFLSRCIWLVPPARARNVERLGQFHKTMEPGLNFVIPMIDKVKDLIDLREQVVSFTGQRVITEDNVVVSIDTVLFFQVTDPRAADYEIVDYIGAIEQLAATMLRSVIGSMDLEQTLTSRDKINTLLRGVLDDASGKWGIRVTRVEIRSIDPPQSIKDAMEKQLKAERQAAVLRAEGQAQAIATVFRSIHEADPDPKLLAYQYLQTLPQLAQGQGNTVWMIPSELTGALRLLGAAFGGSRQAAGSGAAAGSVVPPAGEAPGAGGDVIPAVRDPQAVPGDAARNGPAASPS